MLRLFRTICYALLLPIVYWVGEGFSDCQPLTMDVQLIHSIPQRPVRTTTNAEPVGRGERRINGSSVCLS